MTFAESPLPSPIHPTQTEQRFILAQLNQLTVVFPSAMVAEILIVERSQILALPFYEQAVLGCVHNAGRIVPLVSMHQIVGTRGLTKESLTVVRLGNMAGVAGIGLVVDRVLGSRSRDELPPDVFEGAGRSEQGAGTNLFRPEVLSDRLWQPQRYFVSISERDLAVHPPLAPSNHSIHPRDL